VSEVLESPLVGAAGGGGIMRWPLRGTTIGLITVITLVAFEAMAVATAMPTAVRALHGLAFYGWAFTAFLVTNVVGMVGSGVLSDRYGPIRPLFAGIAIFGAGLLIAGTAPVMAVFVLGRAVQGFGGGLQIVAVYVVIGAVYSDRQRPKVFAALAGAWVLPALIGPVFSGVLAQHLSWRLVFLGIVPLVVAGGALLVPGMRRLGAGGVGTRGEPAASGRRWWAAVAAASGVAAVQAAGQRPQWASLALALPGAAALVLGLRHLLPRGTVVLRPGVPAVVALRGAMAGSLFSVEALVPLTLTLVHGYSPTAAGVPLMVAAVTWSATSWVQGRSAAPRHLQIRYGFGLIAVGAAGMALVARPGTPGWVAYLAWGVAGVGAGLAWASLSVQLLALSPPAQHGTDSAALQICDAVGSSLCIGFGGVLIAAAERGALSMSTAVLLVDLPMAVLAAAAAALAGRARGPASPAGSAP
jgi:MFS family permease